MAAEGQNDGQCMCWALLKSISSTFESDLFSNDFPEANFWGSPREDFAPSKDPAKTLYDDAIRELNNPAALSSFEAAMVPYPPAAFASPAPKQAWRESEYESRLLYLLTLDDGLFPPIQQDKWLGRHGLDCRIIKVEIGRVCGKWQPIIIGRRIEKPFAYVVKPYSDRLGYQ